MHAYESMIAGTGTACAPWHVIPADQKWVARVLVSEAIIEALEERDTELAEKLARDHTLGLASYVEAHGQELFT